METVVTVQVFSKSAVWSDVHVLIAYMVYSVHWSVFQPTESQNLCIAITGVVLIVHCRLVQSSQGHSHEIWSGPVAFKLFAAIDLYSINYQHMAANWSAGRAAEFEAVASKRGLVETKPTVLVTMVLHPEYFWEGIDPATPTTHNILHITILYEIIVIMHQKCKKVTT